MILPEKDSLAVAMIYSGTMYGGFVSVDFDNDIAIERKIAFLTKCMKSQIEKIIGRQRGRENEPTKRPI